MLEVGVIESQVKDIKVDHIFSFSENGASLPEEFLAVCSVLPAQVLSFFRSLHLGLRPDSPSDSGAITRVVEGVNIYPRKK